KLHQHMLGVNETLENLLQWSNSQMDGWKQQPVVVDLQPLANRVVALFQESASQKGIEPSVFVSSDLRVLADAHQTELIFRNLIHNAIKFTGSGGRVSISATRNNSMIEITFSDTGVGMSSEQLDHLWQEPHIRTTRGTGGERGTGLGLALCREMAMNNGGSLTATSEEGRGSSFLLTLKSVD
ncbi:MAG: HAMP domain-containing histidine kinase, partial [Cyclobacteriaceae bacterium]|nr:HAMP domain-containing histidine kinase [Cyclobacteriaceae bacterium]